VGRSIIVFANDLNHKIARSEDGLNASLKPIEKSVTKNREFNITHIYIRSNKMSSIPFVFIRKKTKKTAQNPTIIKLIFYLI
jgi:hypothetical protein